MQQAPPPTTAIPLVFPHQTTPNAIFSVNACCFHCSIRVVKSQISAVTENMPPDAWEKSVKPAMILPLLRRLALVDPLRRMPLYWLDEDRLEFPPNCPFNTGNGIVVRYWELCHMLRVGPSNREIFFSSFQALASNIMNIMITREGLAIPPEVYLGLWHQVAVIGGADNIVSELRELLARARSGRQLRIEELARYIERCGAVDYVFFLVEKMASEMGAQDFRRRTLNNLCLALSRGRDQRAAKFHAFRMALHPRSVDSQVRTLGPDLMLMCMKWDSLERIVLWEEVLGKWLAGGGGAAA